MKSSKEQFLDEASVCIIEAYRRHRALIIESAARPSAFALKEEGDFSCLGRVPDLSDLESEGVLPQNVRRLLEFGKSIGSIINTPPPETDDVNIAALKLAERAILFVALRLINRLLDYLTNDARFHPDWRMRPDAVAFLGLGCDEKQEARSERELNFCLVSAAICLYVGIPADGANDIEVARSVLRQTGGIFFSTLSSLFGSTAIGRCQSAFIALMDAFGRSDFTDPLKTYIKRRKIMQREIEQLVKNGGRPSMVDIERKMDIVIGKVEQANGTLAHVETNTSTILMKEDKIVRQVGDFGRGVMRTVQAFVGLFMPRNAPPTPAEIKGRLLPSKAAACLERITNRVHRNQIMAVIRYVSEHPIVHKDAHRSKAIDAFTLSKAVKAVWAENHETWERFLDSYPNEEALAAACYALQGKDDDPFVYSN